MDEEWRWVCLRIPEQCFVLIICSNRQMQVSYVLDKYWTSSHSTDNLQEHMNAQHRMASEVPSRRASQSHSRVFLKFLEFPASLYEQFLSKMSHEVCQERGWCMLVLLNSILERLLSHRSHGKFHRDHQLLSLDSCLIVRGISSTKDWDICCSWDVCRRRCNTHLFIGFRNEASPVYLD